MILYPKIGSLYRMKEECCGRTHDSFKGKIFLLIDKLEPKPLIPEMDMVVLLSDNKTYQIYRDNFESKFEEVI